MAGQGIDFCSVYKPIVVSVTDSPETIREVFARNLFYKNNCT